MLRGSLRRRFARRLSLGVVNAAEAGLATVMNGAARLLRPREGLAVVATVSLVAACGSSSSAHPAIEAAELDSGHEGGGAIDSGGVIVEAPAIEAGRPMEGGPVVEAATMPDSGIDTGVLVEAPVMPDSGSGVG
jgi:hypothetical protein